MIAVTKKRPRAAPTAGGMAQERNLHEHTQA
jgi:hypothetical protein